MLSLATGTALPFTGSWSSGNFPSVGNLSVKVPRFPTLGKGREGEKKSDSAGGRRNKMPLAWALSDRLASQFWERKWASQNGKTDSYGKLRVLILMSETGGGHKASATSLADALEEMSSDPLDISIVDVFVKHTSFPFNKIPHIYSFLASKPRMWEALYNTTKATAGTMLGVEEGLALTWIDHFQRCILEEDPDIIISVHPLMQDPVSRVLKRVAEVHLSAHAR